VHPDTNPIQSFNQMNKKFTTLIAAAAVSVATANSHAALVAWGGEYVASDQDSQASLQDISGVPTASDSIRQVGGWGAAAQPASDYTGPAFTGGAQVVKFGLDSTTGSATAKVINDAGGDYISLFAQSPSGTTNSHQSFFVNFDVNTTYSSISAFSGRTAGGVASSVISRFMVTTDGGDIYLSNTSIGGGFGGATWSISDLSAEQWALFTPGSDNWRGDFASLTFDTTLASEAITQVGWFASRDAGTAGFTNATLTIRDFTVVPEPSTYAILAGIGALGLVLLRRRLRR
jgi:hypothetical protein